MRIAGAVAATGMLTACTYDSELLLENLSGHALTPYPVHTEPPPPHRAEDAENVVPVWDARPIDPEGFNPVYYATGIEDETQANGLYLGLDLVNTTDYMIHYRVLHYRVPPGQAGTNPALLPIVLAEGVADVTNVNYRVTVSTPTDVGSAPPGGWTITIAPE
jgi:hypothetical protein